MAIRPMLAIMALVAVGVMGSCGSDPDSDAPGAGGADSTLSDGAVITYRFGDSSVPPPYHRSYTITVTRSEAHVVVDSYGDVVSDTRHPVSSATWGTLSDGVRAVLDLPAPVPTDGCTGGTTRGLRILDGGDTLVDVTISNCAGANEDQVRAVEGYIAPVIAAIPDFGALLDR